ncbi:MAG: RHS repeat protein [Oceanospirillaceae bacterium]|nr:RHS repeat protein [Oceanospirillaceae bacterium]
MKYILILLAVLSTNVIADEVEYFDSHLTVTSPIGNLELGRALHRRGWVYGYNLFNKNFEYDVAQGKVNFDLADAQSCLDKQSCSISGTFDVTARGYRVTKTAELASCDYTINYSNIARDQETNKWLTDITSVDTNCTVNSVSQYFSKHGYQMMGIDADEFDLAAHIKGIFTTQGVDFFNSFYRQATITYATTTLDFDFGNTIILEYFDPKTGRTYGVDNRIRYVKKQTSDPIYINWNDTVPETMYLVPETITDASGNIIVDFAPKLVNENGIAYILPTKIEDKTGRKVDYTYDGDRLTSRTDVLGNTWLYNYHEFSPEENPLDKLIRLSNIEDPEGNQTEFLYQPASALISGYRTPGGGGWNRQISSQKDAFGDSLKIESKVFHNGRVEERIFKYGEVFENLNLINEIKDGTVKNEIVREKLISVQSDGACNQYTTVIVRDKETGSIISSKTERHSGPCMQMVYVSYGKGTQGFSRNQDGSSAEGFSTAFAYAQKKYGVNNAGGAAPVAKYYLNEGDEVVVDEDNMSSSRVLKEFRINGETQFTYEREYQVVDGTHISRYKVTNAFGDKTDTFQYLPRFNKGAKPLSHTIIEQDGYESKHYYYDEYGYIARVKQGDKEEFYEYDVYKNLKRHEIKFAGVSQKITSYTYDERGNLTSVTNHGLTGDSDAVVSMDYDDYQRLVSVTDAENHQLKYQDFHITGQPKTIIDQRNKAWLFTYDAHGNPKSLTDPLSRVQTFVYNKANHLIKRTFADTSFEEYQVDGDGVVTNYINGEGHATGFKYDNAHNLIELQQAKDTEASQPRTWQYQYDAFSQMTKETNPAGEVKTYHYKLDRLLNYKQQKLDVKLSYNNQGKVKQTLWLPEDTQLDKKTYQYGYDQYGRLTTQADALGNITTYNYDGLDQITAMTDPEQGVTYYDWDSRGNLLKVTDPEGREHSYQYDKNNRLRYETWQEGEVKEYRYDPTGKLKTVIDGKGQVSKRTYDDAGQLKQIQYFTVAASTTAQKTITYAYDLKGRLTQWNDGRFVSDYDYDNNGRLTSVALNYGLFTKNQAYTYYPNGNLKTYTNPEGITYTYQFTQNNELQAITIPGIGQLAYTGYQLSSPAQQILPGGNQLQYNYDDYQRLAGFDLIAANGETLASNTYQHDAEDNIAEFTDAQGIHTLAYNDRYALTHHAIQPITIEGSEAANDEFYEEFTYDGVNNRLTESTLKNGELKQASYIYNRNNQLMSSSEIQSGTTQNTSYKYDANGALINKLKNTSSELSYQYNLQGRMAKVFRSNGSLLAEYFYSPQGYRLQKNVYDESGANPTTTYFLYNRQGLAGEYDAQGNLIAEYHYDLTESDGNTSNTAGWSVNVLFTRQNGQVYFYQNDYRFARQRIIDQAGKIVWQAHYSAFEMNQILIAEIKNPLRFPGQYEDNETGIYYNIMRNYDGSLGRYLQSDPIGLEAGVNFYGYVHANPYINVDPEGLKNNISRSEIIRRREQSFNDRINNISRNQRDRKEQIEAGVKAIDAIVKEAKRRTENRFPMKCSQVHCFSDPDSSSSSPNSCEAPKGPKYTSGSQNCFCLQPEIGWSRN